MLINNEIGIIFNSYKRGIKRENEIDTKFTKESGREGVGEQVSDHLSHEPSFHPSSHRSSIFPQSNSGLPILLLTLL